MIMMTTIHTPPIARLLFQNDRRVSPLRSAGPAWTSPPSRTAATGADAPASACTAAESGPPAGDASCPGIADPRVEYAVGDVSEQVAHDRGHPDDKRGAEQDREVVRKGGLPEEQAHAGEIEDRLRDNRAADDVGQGQAENRHYRQQRIAKQVLYHYQPLRHSLGPDHADVVR